MWQVTTAIWDHNHAPWIPDGGTYPSFPSTAHWEIVEKLPDSLNHSQVAAILKEHIPSRILEPCQISNLINAAKQEARD